MMTTEPTELFINLEFTPNPNTLKYSVNREVLSRGARQFRLTEHVVGVSPLADALFEVSGIESVMLGKDFVTVSKAEQGDWDVVHQGSLKALQEFFAKGLSALTEQEGVLDMHKAPASELEQKIITILDEEIRPSVAMDGGDITFERFENGIVYLFLQGSCSGCPSSTITLKMGIESRLKEAIPEVLEVVAV